MLYDSFENEYSCYEKIFDKFNNRKCSKLEKKAKIFVIDSHNTIVDDNNKSNDDAKIDYVDQYKRVIYANTMTNNDNNSGDFNSINNNTTTDDVKQDLGDDSRDDDGGVLINSFCVSLCNNINDTDSSQENDDIKDLNYIIKETESRINKANVLNQTYDENYIPNRCQIVFTSFKPLHSTKYVLKNDSNINIHDKKGMLETVSEMQSH